MDNQRKDNIDPKRPSQKDRPQQLPTYNVPTYDVENTNSTNKWRDLLLADKLQIVPWRTERMLQRIQRHWRTTLHRSIYPHREQDETKKSRFGLDWLQKGIWYGPTKLGNKLPQNAHNNRWSHKLYRENHENLESGIDSWRAKFSWREDSKKKNIPRRCTITITIYNCDDATEPLTQKMHSWIQTCKSQEKITYCVCIDDIKLCAKNEKELETLVHAVRI